MTGLGWMDHALCAEIGGDLWTPKQGQPGKQARKVCGQCFVREPCLEYALANPHVAAEGIWGGMGSDERRRLLAGRRRAA